MLERIAENLWNGLSTKRPGRTLVVVRLFTERPVGLRGWLDKLTEVLLVIALLLSLCYLTSGDELRAYFGEQQQPAGEPLGENSSEAVIPEKLLGVS